MRESLFMTPEARVIVEIRKCSENGGDIYFSRLRDSFEDSLSPVTLNRCIKRLENQGLLEFEWKQLEGEDARRLGNRWVRKISISEEAVELVELLDRTQEIMLENR
jgi:DNA-binding PadR family transcriptional regulator